MYIINGDFKDTVDRSSNRIPGSLKVFRVAFGRLAILRIEGCLHSTL